ncbi:DUF58 domain-containing protein [Alkalimarinus sediminis]|uniref:DUF58 domain-containing protein n=1 Tax=Alkalimarinus sediminis TaxID=1632866 RepID=A0A9E8KQE9_9ALTE|nr:DUF58 domain-containing protein [Alkalimarinus sediminis]UZW74632.1 DUF58 domain-containing protein [Alkalimarinus sediminis]
MASIESEKPDHKVYADFQQLVAMQHLAAGFSFLPKQAVQSILSGRHASKLRGRGLNFEELRHYRPGDDIRTLDWKVTNRTKKPHVRVYTEERERSVLLLVDQRVSMFFGSRVKMKSVVAAEMAGLSIWRTLAVGDRVGALVFNDTEIKEIKPQRSRKTALQILHQITTMNHALNARQRTAQNSDQLNHALQEAERLCGHDFLIVVVSDMSGWNDETIKRIKRLTVHNDLIVPLIFDPLEKELPDHQQLVVSDGHVQIEVDARKHKLKQRFTEGFVSSVDFLQGELRKYGVPVIPIDTEAPVQDQVRVALGQPFMAGGGR